MMNNLPSSEIAIGPVLKVFIEFDPDREQAQLVESCMPFIPRIGELLTWGPMDNRIHGEVTDVSWILSEQDEEGVVHLMHVCIVARPLSLTER